MKIGLVLVTYRMEMSIVLTKLKRYIDFFDKIVVVDNTPNNTQNCYNFFPNCEYFSTGENMGIAKAQNIGSLKIMDYGIDYLMYLDQDSSLDKKEFFKLKKSLKELKEIKLGAIGPRPVNSSTMQPYKGRFKNGKPFSSKNIIETTEIISSGMIIPVKVYKDVGGYEESLFIDGVDHEWCWRARTKGYKILMNQNVKLNHQVGEGDKFIFFIRFRVPAPIRTYYQYRNYFKLIKRSYVPVYWKISNAIKYVIKIIVYSFFFENGKEYRKHIMSGIIDGIRNNDGV